MFVDSNAHVTVPLHQRGQFPVMPFRGAGGAVYVTDEPSIEEYVALIETAGISHAFLISSRNHGFDNRYCAYAARTRPGRFVAVACVDAFSADVHAELDRWIASMGMDGVRVWGGGPGTADWQSERRFDGLWQHIEELGVPMNVQTTNATALPDALAVLEKFPRLRMTINNLAQLPLACGPGSPEAELLLRFADYEGVFVNVSIAYLEKSIEAGSAPAELLRAVVERFTPHRILWTPMYPSLYPMADGSARAYEFGHSVKILEDAFSFLSEEDRQWVYGKAAQQLYPALRA